MGKIREGWEEVELNSITLKIGSGFTPKGGAKVYIDKGTALIRSQNIYNAFFDYNGLVYIDKDIAKTMSNVEVLEDDILINITGDSVARVTQVPKSILPARVNQHVSILRFNDKVSSKFLMYSLTSQENQAKLLNIASGAGSTRNALTKMTLSKFKVNLPPLPTQQKIASVLSAYDDLIENNLKRIQILEEMAQQTYEEWFVRMRYSGHENDKTDPTTGLPKGWERVRLGDIYKTSSGGTPSRNKPEYYKNGTIDWIKTKELGSLFILNSEEKITEEAVKNSSAKLFPPKTILMGMYGGVHKEGMKSTLGQVGITTKESASNQACCAFLKKEKYNYNLGYLYLYLKNNQQGFLNISMGAAQQNISQQIIKSFSFIKPKKNILYEFNSFTEEILNSILNLQYQNQRLRESRDILLPRLMMGLVDVEEVMGN